MRSRISLRSRVRSRCCGFILFRRSRLFSSRSCTCGGSSRKPGSFCSARRWSAGERLLWFSIHCCRCSWFWAARAPFWPGRFSLRGGAGRFWRMAAWNCGGLCWRKRACAGVTAHSRTSAAPTASRDGECQFILDAARLAGPQLPNGEVVFGAKACKFQRCPLRLPEPPGPSAASEVYCEGPKSVNSFFQPPEPRNSTSEPEPPRRPA